MVVFADLDDLDDAPDIHRPSAHHLPLTSKVERVNPNLDNGFSAALSCYP